MIPKILQTDCHEIPYRNQVDFDNIGRRGNNNGKKKEHLGKAFSYTLQAVFFLQFLILLTLMTSCIIFKLEWQRGSGPAAYYQTNLFQSNITSLCQIEDMNYNEGLYGATVSWNWDGINALVQNGFNWLIGFHAFFLFATVFLLLYLRHENWKAVIGVVVIWAIIILYLDYQWSWDYVWNRLVHLFEPIITIQKKIVSVDDFDGYINDLEQDVPSQVKKHGRVVRCFMKVDFLDNE